MSANVERYLSTYIVLLPLDLILKPVDPLMEVVLSFKIISI